MMTLCRTECYTSYFRRNSRWPVTLGSLGGNSAVCSGVLSAWVSCEAGWSPAGKHPDRPIRLRIGWWWSTVRPSPILVQKGASLSLHRNPWYINMISMAWREFKREMMVINGSIHQNKLHNKVHHPTLLSLLTAPSCHKLYSWPYLYKSISHGAARDLLSLYLFPHQLPHYHCHPGSQLLHLAVLRTWKTLPPLLDQQGRTALSVVYFLQVCHHLRSSAYDPRMDVQPLLLALSC